MLLAKDGLVSIDLGGVSQSQVCLVLVSQSDYTTSLKIEEILCYISREKES